MAVGPAGTAPGRIPGPNAMRAILASSRCARTVVEVTTTPDPQPGPGKYSGVMVRCDVAADGAYQLVLEFTGTDTVRPLDEAEAHRYAATVARAASYAETDAAVLDQLVNKLGLPRRDAAGVVADLRERRPALDAAAIAPLELAPSISAITGKPFLAVGMAGRASGQWTLDDARGHAVHVLEALATVDTDTAYFEYLAGSDGRVGPDRARAAVEDVANFRASHVTGD
jgi:hypothetical protein